MLALFRTSPYLYDLTAVQATAKSILAVYKMLTGKKKRSKK